MQSRVTTPRSTSRGQAAWYEDEGDVSVSASSSRYRVLDEDQKKRETEDVDRLINDLKAQRRCRSSNSRVRKSSSRQEAPVVPIRSGSPRLKDKSERLKLSQRGSGRHSFEDDVGGGDELLPGDEQNPDAVSQSFQDQVLNELRKLKEAQRFEFEALERLQREKDEAERKARHLEQQLRQQQRQLSHREGKSSLGSGTTRRIKTRQEVILANDASDEENNDEIYSSENRNSGDACEQSELETERGDHELIDWDDVTKSPPPYFTTASPATSPFKRSSGWPAWTGDESLPPGPASDPLESEPAEPLRHRSRSRNKLEPTSLSRSRSNSAMSSHVRRLSQSRSRSPSATRTNRSAQDSQELRRSCAFFEDKARAQAEAEQRSKESAERLERACRAAPPQKLLERQALADERRSQQLRELDKTNAELAREKRAKPREVPVATYLSAGDAEAAEQKRKERIRQRAQEMVQAAEMPSRMAMATKKATADATPAGEGWSEVDHMSVKLKKKLRQAAEEEAKRRQHRPKPVPNFDQLHSQWDAALKKRMELARRNQHEEDSVNNDDEAPSKKRSAEFFTSRADKLAELREQKEARKLRLQAKEEAIQQHAKRAQEKLLTRARASLGTDVGSQRKPTKSEALRAQKLMAETTKQQKERLREERDADARERRREEATRRVRAQVNRSENVRRDNFAGTFVDLKDLDAVAKEKAREQRQQFKEAIARNKEKLLAAAAARPSLMERFTTGVKRETHRRAALEAVVKTVFQKDLSALKGVLTDDEQELAREMVAADEAKSDKNSEDD
ncbi:hypothetical protein KRP22_013692 [Phytophthora ramorum]|nr:hypothetical protein KRP22_11134 [Phytophthora ramorum]